MTASERRYLAARKRELRRYTELNRRTIVQVRGYLDEARGLIVARLAGAPSDWSSDYYQRQIVAVDAAIERWRTRTAQTWSQSFGRAWELGDDLVKGPLAAAGISPTLFGRIDDRQLVGLQAWSTRKITNISTATRQQIESQLALVLSGAQSSGQATDAIQGILGSSRKRAVTITRTELGRAYSTATYLSLQEKAGRIPGLKKQWRRSGKRHSRFNHDLTDGQIKPIDEHFTVGGERLMFPRDPTASAKNTINCGCTLLPYKDDWKGDLLHPRRQPFTEEEMAIQPLRREFLPLQQSVTSTPGQGLQAGTALTLDDALLAGRDVLQTIAPLVAAAGNGEVAVQAILDELRKVRPLGGANAFKGSTEGRQWMTRAADRYPAAWNSMATAYGPHFVRMDPSVLPRAYHLTWTPAFVQRAGAPQRMTGFRQAIVDGAGYTNMRRDMGAAVHEYGHRLQATVPGLDALFQELHRRRTTGEDLRALPNEPTALARWDQYINPYAGREYPSVGYGMAEGSLEVLTMAFQYLLGGNLSDLRTFLQDDPELASLALGVLWKY